MPAQGEYSVVQFFENGHYEYVRRGVSALAAVEAARHYTSSVAARLGVVVRVIITDSGDQTNFEWKHGEGITFPHEARNPHWPSTPSRAAFSSSSANGKTAASGADTPNGEDK